MLSDTISKCGNVGTMLRKSNKYFLDSQTKIANISLFCKLSGGKVICLNIWEPSFAIEHKSRNYDAKFACKKKQYGTRMRLICGNK